MAKPIDKILLDGLRTVGIGILRGAGLRSTPDERARIKAEQKKNKNRVIECSGCGKEMIGSKDPKSDSDEEVIYTCESCNFTRDIRKERISPKSISQFYNETQKKKLAIFETGGTLFKCSGGKLPDKNTCKAVFISHLGLEVSELNKKMDNCPYCGAQLRNLGKVRPAVLKVKERNNGNTDKGQDDDKELEEILATKRLAPTRMLPFLVSQSEVVPAFKRWIQKEAWLQPRDLKKIANPDVVKGIYVPQFFIEKGQTRTTWSAMGEGSQNTVRKQPKDKDKSDKKGPDNDTHVLLQTGYLERDFSLNNNASSGMMGDLLAKIRELNGKQLVPYDPGYLRGWVYELYQKDVTKAFKNWQKKLNETTSKEVKRRVHGNVYSKIKDDGKKFEDLHIQTEVTKQNIEHILIPVWVAFYRYSERCFFFKKDRGYQFLINGFTGQIVGKKPVSCRKLAILYSLIALVMSLIVWFAHTYWHNPGQL